MKILIAEDDKALNNGIALSLGEYEMEQAFSLAEAEKILDESISLIILDVNFPDGNGIDFCKKVREKSHIPVIFLTANDMEVDIVNGLEAGGDDYITKPFSLAVWSSVKISDSDFEKILPLSYAAMLLSVACCM